MKKTFVLCMALGILGLNATSVKAQKNEKSIPATKLTPAIPKLVNNADSVSYVYGLAMTEGNGFTSFLTQAGIVRDTSEINAEYKVKIETEKNESKKEGLRKEYAKLLKETTDKNNSNLDSFLEGFYTVLLEKDSNLAYNLGASTATQISSTSDKFSNELLGDSSAFNKLAFYHAFASRIKGNKPLVDIENPQEMIMKTAEAQQIKKQEKEKEAQKAKYKKQIDEGEAFLAKNKKKKGVVTLESGLQYKVVTAGKGEKPKAEDIVSVHYKGTLLDGTKFDSSYDRGEPTTLSVGHVIKGWSEALQLMPIGSKWELYIPYVLGYGESDMGTIKPFSTLVFEVELLDIIDAKALQEEMESSSQQTDDAQ